MRLASLTCLAIAACGGGKPAATPANSVGASGGRLAAPPDPDPSQVCDVFATITVDVVYDGACAGPPRISLDYNPTAPHPVELTDGTYGHATVLLDVQSFDAKGCRGQIIYELGEGNLEATFYASGPEQVAGTGIYRDEDGAECAARLSGGWKPWPKK
jgi:hypothetical protein